MADLTKRASIAWLKVRERPQEVVLLSDCYEWATHWDVDHGRTRRCGGADCYLCSIGQTITYRYVFFASSEDGRVWALELRDGQRGAIDQANSRGNCAGSVLSIRLEGRAITATFLYRDDSIAERPIDSFGSSLGLAPLTVDRSQSIAAKAV